MAQVDGGAWVGAEFQGFLERFLGMFASAESERDYGGDVANGLGGDTHCRYKQRILAEDSFDAAIPPMTGN